MASSTLPTYVYFDLYSQVNLTLLFAEASKIVMRYVASVCGKEKEIDRVMQMLLQSNPLLECKLSLLLIATTYRRNLKSLSKLAYTSDMNILWRCMHLVKYKKIPPTH